MDFGSLLLEARKNENKQGPSRFYQTKFSAPKKETKQSKELSEGIKKFLAKKAEEEKQKALEEKKKREHLLSLRDQKTQNKINKHLKICKSANKSVLEDAVDNENTAVTLAGPAQCDEDDYGYVSKEASAFYDKLMNKYISQPPEKSIFSNDGKKTPKDIASTKDRVKQALRQQQLEESLPHKRKRKHKESDQNSIHEINDKKQDSDSEKDEDSTKVEKPKPKKKIAPPPFDYTALLQMAEKKQHEPLKIVPKVKEEPERLLTKKQMKEITLQKEWRERKEQRNRESEKSVQPNDNSSIQKSRALKDPKLNIKALSDIKFEKTVPKTLPNISKKSLDNPAEKSNYLNRSMDKNIVNKTIDKNSAVNKYQNNNDLNRSIAREKSNSLQKNTNSNMIKSTSKNNITSKNSSSKQSEKEIIAEERKQLEKERRQLEEMRKTIEEEKKKLLLNKNKKADEGRPNSLPQKSTGIKTKEPMKSVPSASKSISSKESSSSSIKSRPFPPADVKPRQFPPADVRPRQFPPADVRPRQFPPADVRSSKQKFNSKLKVNKRRIYDDDDDEDEYDSLDDFIDDEVEDDGPNNYSKYISEIFGYDKSKFKDFDDEDDRAMESNFAQQLREEFVSTKQGMLEDLEDIEKERLEKERKKLKKRRLK